MNWILPLVDEALSVSTIVACPILQLLPFLNVPHVPLQVRLHEFL